jgi:hypothetical protein
VDREPYSQWLLRGSFAFLLVRYPDIPIGECPDVPDPWVLRTAR